MEDLLCPHCGVRQPSAGARFCFNCGRTLAAPGGEDQAVDPSPPATAAYDTPPRRNNWLLPAGLVLAALLAFLAWQGVQAVVGPAQPAWTPGPTAAVSTPMDGGVARLTPETPVSRARPATATLQPTPTATLSPTPSATAARPATSTATPRPSPTPAPTNAPILAPTAPPTATFTAPTPGGGNGNPTDRLIAFVSEETGRPQIHIVQADGSNGRRLTTEGANRSPAWAPDNRAIYYVSERGDRSGIYRYDLIAGREDPVVLGSGLGRPQPVAGVALSARQQTAGGCRLVLTDRVIFELDRPFDFHWLPDGAQVLIDPLADPREIYKVDVASGRVSTVAPQRSWNASWGPRGEILYVSNNPGVAFVFVASNDGADPVRTSPPDKWAQAPAWSPDGRWIAYVAGDGPAWNLYRMSADGQDSTRLAGAANPDKSPLWEPNGERLVFESNARGNWDIAVVDLSGTTRVVAGAAANEYDPAWSN